MSTTYDTASIAVNKEDLNDVIAMLAADRAPMFNKFAKTKASATLHEWVEDKLRDAASNAQVEGKTFTYASARTDVRKSNSCQILDAEYFVSGTQQAVDKVGAKDELKRNLENAMKELARDAEYTACATAAAVTGTTAAARVAKGFYQMVATANVVTNSATATLTESLFNDLLQKVYTNANPDIAVVNGTLKRAISKFATVTGRNTEVKNGKLPSSVATYDSDFGLIEILLDPQMGTKAVLVGQADMFEFAFLRPFAMVDGLTKTKDGTNGVVLGEMCPVLRNSYAAAWGENYVPAT